MKSGLKKSVELIGRDTDFTSNYKLNGKKKGLPINIIPSDMYSFGDYLYDKDSIFNKIFRGEPKKVEVLIEEYDSEIVYTYHKANIYTGCSTTT